ncbi:cytochrome P450 [Mycena latifolia]|nr:cytochrome P450 [Mycena latifolia]
MTSKFRVSIVATFASYLLFKLVKVLYEDLTSPLRDLPGPPRGNPILGHFRQMNSDSALTRKWREEFGTNFQYRSLFNNRALYTTDTTALNHILVNDCLYQKGPIERNILRHFLGNGLLAVETDEHKRQRKILNPAFGGSQIRQLTSIFTQRSIQLRDIWTRQIAAEESGSSRIEVFSWLRKMTLDVIGHAGFNYQFDAMEPKGQPNELVQALYNLFHSGQSQAQAAFRLVQEAVPALRIIPTPVGKIMDGAQRTMFNIGNQLLADSRASLKIESGMIGAERDLLSILVKGNMSDDIPEHQRLTDAEVIAQFPTFFIAGHETTSTATAWALHALSINPVLQTKLREELLSNHNDDPTMEELNSLPYLECVIRETMRLYSPVAFTFRMAMEDDVIPLSQSFTDRKGKLRNTIPVRKGTVIHIPIAGVHLDKEIWGDDVDEFRPERWAEIPEGANAIPSIWANLLTFLAGPHNCIGFRFALVEIKALLFTLIRAFEFDTAVPEGGIIASSTAIQRPKVRTDQKNGGQLPLIVRPYVAA